MTHKNTNWALCLLLSILSLGFVNKAEAAPYCMTDIFGYAWDLNVTPTGGGSFSLVGTCLLTSGEVWNASGTYDRNTATVNLTATNPNPDGCVLVSGSFTYDGTVAGGALTFNWTNDCGAAGTGTGNAVGGSCRFAPTVFDGAIAGPAAADQRAMPLYCMSDAFGYLWDLNVSPTGGGSFGINGTCQLTDGSIWTASGSYNRNTATFDLTATNPAPDGCVLVSGSFTYTGTVAGASLTFTWTNDCGAAGSGSGTASGGTCRTGSSNGLLSGPAIAPMEVDVMPNPVRDFATIQYTVAVDQDVAIEIFNAQGQRVDLLFAGTRAAGTHTIQWDASQLSNGLYFYSINGEQGQIVVQH